MKIENHYIRLKENLDVIEENLKRNLVERQGTIAYSIYSASMHMIEILLHKNVFIPFFRKSKVTIKIKNMI